LRRWIRAYRYTANNGRNFDLEKVAPQADAQRNLSNNFVLHRIGARASHMELRQSVR